ncbi:MAG: hypothetical protein LAO31_22195 [Acidobacteriia bacterium]|nr:hypothetical protein [Terriglobia bacterium]
MIGDSPECLDAEKRDRLRHGLAWLILSLAVGVHVTDEALTNFLSVYNPAVLAIRHRLPFLPLPTFTFKSWLVGLIAAVLLLFALSPFAFRGARWVSLLAYALSILMLGNGLGHISGSIYMGRLMPGVYSSPFLLCAALYLFLSTRRLRSYLPLDVSPTP